MQFEHLYHQIYKKTLQYNELISFFIFYIWMVLNVFLFNLRKLLQYIMRKKFCFGIKILYWNKTIEKTKLWKKN